MSIPAPRAYADHFAPQPIPGSNPDPFPVYAEDGPWRWELVVGTMEDPQHVWLREDTEYYRRLKLPPHEQPDRIFYGERGSVSLCADGKWRPDPALAATLRVPRDRAFGSLDEVLALARLELVPLFETVPHSQREEQA